MRLFPPAVNFCRGKRATGEFQAKSYTLCAQWSADLVQALKDFPVGLKHARLVIGNRALLAEGFDEKLRFSQSVPGHSREEVMLDLVVQTAIPEIGEGAGFDIAGSEHLLAQEVQLAVFIQNRHAFVVWCSN